MVTDALEKQNVDVNEQTLVIPTIEIENCDGLDYLDKIDDNSIDLILTDPPYSISKDSGMNKHYDTVKSNEKEGIEFVKTEEDWIKYTNTKQWKKFMVDNEIIDENSSSYKKCKTNFLKYGSRYGKKFCVKTDFGKWDNDFTLEKLDEFIKRYYIKLRKGGTLIVFFDMWKITYLKDLMEKYKFKQIRFIEWIKNKSATT